MGCYCSRSGVGDSVPTGRFHRPHSAAQLTARQPGSATPRWIRWIRRVRGCMMRAMRYEVVTADTPLSEGPVWCPDGTLVVSLISPGALVRVQPENGKVKRIVALPGGANSAQLADDGGFVVANNGGIDFTVFADALRLDAAKIPYRPGPPGLQRIAGDGGVSVLADEGLQAPNDLIVARDGTIYFTDPPPHGGLQSPGGEGRLWSYAEGELRLVARGFKYDNGVALSPEGRLLIVEAQGLLWIDPASGEREWWIEELPGESPGDGF